MNLEQTVINSLVEKYGDQYIMKSQEKLEFQETVKQIPTPIWEKNIRESTNFAVRLALCDMGNLPISLAYQHPEVFCRIDLLNTLLKLFKYVEYIDYHVYSDDILDELIPFFQNPLPVTDDETSNNVLLSIYNLYHKDPKYNTRPPKPCQGEDPAYIAEYYADLITNLEDLMDDIFKTEFFINKETDNFSHYQFLQITLKRYVHGLMGTTNFDVMSNLYGSNVTFDDILQHISRLEDTPSKVFLVENKSYKDDILKITYATF